ncbi:Tn7-like element transposition protein TnsE [Brevibacillus invocatus]|uniref:Tn7-like element transposition protein TnsE n=1 Tax=Brevibacillus invocatus TaxID=173959 RepID=UPI00203D8F9B|nr:Tn7-like element transposition protein TnsE [Brevibacillus invocatus]MCM3081681.1 Tn7-like element transposition protein TnsE [Brevibacillus invocatus]MCM3432089.1 Tn7-like element transposition protein TnsE [Brevibacillus invocatus]
MGSLTLRTWPFQNNEPVELVWFGSPFLDYRGNWRIKVAFRDSRNTLKIETYPWGTLPYLRLGQVYINGETDPVKPLSGSGYVIKVKHLSQGVKGIGFDLPIRLISFDKKPELGLQKIIKFQSEGNIFCIPMIELIRALFINSRHLAYYMMQPHGIDLLVDRCEYRGDSLWFDMSQRVPAKLAQKNNARHLSWIYCDPAIRSMWDSVYQLMFASAVKDSPLDPTDRMKKGIPLDMELSRIGPIELYVRGIDFMDHILVQEIIGFSGFYHPVKDIHFWHPSKKRRESVYADKKVRVSTRPDRDEYILNDRSVQAKEDLHQDVIEAPPTYLRFSNSPKVTTRQDGIQKTNTGNDFIMKPGKGGKNAGAPEEVSTQDSVVGGDTPPIEFQTIETVSVHEAIGLERFFKMIEILKQVFLVDIRLSVVRVPLGKRFSVCPNGTRRTCAIVQLTNGNSTSYVIEVARPDDWSISTLMIRPTGHVPFSTIEADIQLLLEGMVEKGGHWDQNVLNRCRNMDIDKIRHYESDSPRDWAGRLIRKIT